MKKSKILVIIGLIAVSFFGNAQTNFVWDTVKTDAVGSKDHLHDISKYFISDVWRSTTNEVILDDPKNGVLIVRGVTAEPVKSFLMNQYFYYSYDIKFLVEQNQCRVIVENVKGVQTQMNNSTTGLIPVVLEVYPSTRGKRITGTSEEKYTEAMKSLKNDIQGLVNLYLKTVQLK